MSHWITPPALDTRTWIARAERGLVARGHVGRDEAKCPTCAEQPRVVVVPRPSTDHLPMCAAFECKQHARPPRHDTHDDVADFCGHHRGTASFRARTWGVTLAVAADSLRKGQARKVVMARLAAIAKTPNGGTLRAINAHNAITQALDALSRPMRRRVLRGVLVLYGVTP